MRSSNDIQAVPPCDLKLKNVRLVNVFSSEIISTDIHITGSRIVSIDPESCLEARRTKDCGSRPGNHRQLKTAS